MSDTYRDLIMRRLRGAPGANPGLPAVVIANNAARATAAKLATVLRPTTPANEQAIHGYAVQDGRVHEQPYDPTAAAQRFAAFKASQLLSQPGPIQPNPIPGSTRFQLGGGSDTIMSVPSGGYEGLGVNPRIVAAASVPGATTPLTPPEPPPLPEQPNVPQWADIKKFELNTQLPDGTLNTPEPEVEQPVPENPYVEIDQAEAALQVARDWYLADGGPESQAAFAKAQADYDAAVAQYSNQTLPGEVMDLIDKPRQLVVTEMGANAYDVATGKRDEWGADWAAVAPGNWNIPGLDWTRFNQDFKAWAEDPANWQAIRYASEHGFQASPTDPRYTGGRAVWELFINGAGNSYRFLSDILNDPTILAGAGKAIGDPLIETAVRAAPEGNMPLVATAKVLGTALSTPQNILDKTVDAPFNAVGRMFTDVLGKRSRVVGGLMEETPSARAAEQVNVADEATTHQDRIRREGIGFDDLGGGAPSDPLDVPPPPSDPGYPRYTMRSDGKQWVIYDPTGVPTGETLPFREALPNAREPNYQQRLAQRRVNELNRPIIRNEDLAHGVILPDESIGLTWTDPAYERLTNKGRSLPGTLVVQVADAVDDPRMPDPLRRQWMDNWAPRAKEHEEIMNDFRVQESNMMAQHGLSAERDLVQKGQQLLYPRKTYELIRYYVDDQLLPFMETFPQAQPSPRPWITSEVLGPTDANNLIEHAVLGTREDAIRARKMLRQRNVTIEGFRGPIEFVEHLGQMGERINGPSWRSADPTAVKSRQIRGKRAGEPKIDAAAVSEVTGKPKLTLKERTERINSGALKREVDERLASLQLGQNQAEVSHLANQAEPDPIEFGDTAQHIDQKINTDLAAEFEKTTRQLADQDAEDALLREITDPTTKSVTPGKNRIDAKTPGEIVVKKPGSRKKVKVQKTADAWEVVAEPDATPIPVETVQEAVAVSDEVIARYDKGIESVPAQVERVVADVAPESAKTRKPSVRRNQVVVEIDGKSDREIANQILDETVRSVTPGGNRIERTHTTSRTKFSVSPIKSKGRRYINIAQESPFGQASNGPLKWAVVDKGPPTYHATLADAIRASDDALGGTAVRNPGIVSPETAKSINMEPRVRENILRQAGALEGPGASDADMLARTDRSYVAAAYQMGKIDQATYLKLNQWVEWDGQQMKLWEAYDRALEWLPDPAEAKRVIASKAIDEQTLADLAMQRAKVDARKTGQRAAFKALSAYQTLLQFEREAIMFNWARGFSGAFADAVGTNFSLILHGEFDAAFKNMNPLGTVRHFIQDERGKKLAVANLPGMDRYTYLTGTTPPPSVMQLVETRFETGHAGMVLERTGGVYNLLRPIADKDIKALRTGLDRNSRYSLHMASFDKNIKQAQNRFRGIVATRAQRTGNDYVDWLRKLDRLGNDYNPDDILRTFNDERLARDWREMISTARIDAKKRVDQILFSYKMTRADDLLRNTVFFHYWMSRALPMHTKVAFRNPWLLSAYQRAWDHMQREAEQHGYPPSVRGFIEMQRDDSGFYGLLNPINILVPFGMLIEQNDDPGVFAFLKQWGFFINPVIESAAASLGWTTTVPDITATLSLRRAMRYTVNWLNANGYDELVPNVLGDPNTWQSSIVDEAQYRMIDKINTWAQRAANALAPSQRIIADYEGTSKGAYESDVLNSILIHELEKTYGPYADWGPESPAWDAYLDARDDIAMGRDGNVLADTVVEIMADAKMENVLQGAVIPGGVYQRYGPRDETLAEARTGDQTAWDERGLATGGNPELTVDLQQLDRLGTENGRKGYALWNEIAFGDDFDDNDALVLNGQTIRGWQIKAMSDEQRKELADAWLAQYDSVPDEVEQYRALREEFLAANPQAGDFKEYQKGVGKMADQPGGIKAWRTMYAKKDAAFREAMGKREAELRKQGKIGDVLDAELDRWAMTPEAYNAANGYQDSIYDAPATPKVPEYGFTSGDQSTKRTTPKDPMTKLKDEITGYQEKVDEALAALRAAGYNVTAADLYTSSPLYADVFRDYGVPDPSDDVLLFLQWSSLPENAGATVDDFILYLEDLGQKAA